MRSETLEQLVARVNRSAYVPSLKESVDMAFTPAKAKPVSAKQAEKFVFREKKAFGAGTEYPWTDWLDGNLYMLKQGEHFSPADNGVSPKQRTANFAGLVKLQCAKRGQEVRVQVMDDNMTVAIQAVGSPDADRAAEFIAHEKAKIAARKAKKKAAANGDTSEPEGDEAE